MFTCLPCNALTSGNHCPRCGAALDLIEASRRNRAALARLASQRTHLAAQDADMAAHTLRMMGADEAEIAAYRASAAAVEEDKADAHGGVLISADAA